MDMTKYLGCGGWGWPVQYQHHCSGILKQNLNIDREIGIMIIKERIHWKSACEHYAKDDIVVFVSVVFFWFDYFHFMIEETSTLIKTRLNRTSLTKFVGCH